MTRCSKSARPSPRQLAAVGGLVLALCLTGVTAGSAQQAGRGKVQLAGAKRPVTIEYAPNESGGRIALIDQIGDSAAVETIHRELLEAAASFRRGDFRTARLMQAGLPAGRVMAEQPGHVTCIFRPLPKGGELVILADDDQTIAAIHQLLSVSPNKS